MAYVNSLSTEEREALEQGFREHLAKVVPAIVAKRFIGGETWCTDPIIRGGALTYLKATRSSFPAIPTACNAMTNNDE